MEITSEESNDEEEENIVDENSAIYFTNKCFHC